jgi:predicted nucleic acid-binding protein
VKIIVNDANILIDLVDIDLLNEIIKLDIELHSNDFIISEIKNPTQLKKINTLIIEKKLFIAKTEISEYEKILELQTKNLSFEDCSIWYYSQKVNGILLTGDANLRKTAKKSGIEVRGILFVFDKLVENKIINTILAIEKLKKLCTINTRLPIEEVNSRIAKWSNK